MARAKKSYWMLKYDVIKMRLPFPFLENFPVRHQEFGEGMVKSVFYDKGCCFVEFQNQKSCNCKVNDLFDLSGMWTVDFDKLARRSDAYKASYEEERRRHFVKITGLRDAKRHWAEMYGAESLQRLILEVEKGQLLFDR